MHVVTGLEPPVDTHMHQDSTDMFEFQNEKSVELFSGQPATNVGIEEQRMLNEIDEHVALIPEKNQLQHTKFMFKLQTQHFLEQIEEKKRTMKYYEQQYANQFDKNSPNA